MPSIRINGLDHYFEQIGAGPALVLIHGAFGDASMWEPQWQHFAAKYRLLRYDLRGHGRTGPSDPDQYTIETFSDDLTCLLDELDISAPVICGHSFGGIVAQAFAVQNPDRLRGLILSGTMAAIDLTPMDKLLCRVLFPKFAMTLTIRMLSVKNFTRFSLWLGRLTRGKQFLSQDSSIDDYLEQCMLKIEQREYLKIWRALYRFKLLPLEKITCPTLVLNGEHEPKNNFYHTQEILRRIPQARALIIPKAHHVSNMENPHVFNQLVDEFLQNLPFCRLNPPPCKEYG